MYAGRIVEEAEVGALVRQPRHPYTRGLLGATVGPEHRGRPLAAIAGAPPDLRDLPPGCAFAPRCERAGAECREGVPTLQRAGTSALACWNPPG
jgi:peptide/nickel transport system ATP-binding protein